MKVAEGDPSLKVMGLERAHTSNTSMHYLSGQIGDCMKKQKRLLLQATVWPIKYFYLKNHCQRSNMYIDLNRIGCIIKESFKLKE